MGEKITNQKQEVLRHIKRYGSITSMEAFEKYGITRLSAIIYILRREYEIVTLMRTSVNRYGNEVNFAEYRLWTE
nr:MAG TPA: helix-turn-helix domain protein [Caudoviricetes sp.]